MSNSTPTPSRVSTATTELPIAQVTMTLAALAYWPTGDAAKQGSDLTSALANPNLPTQARWRLVWGPHTVDRNLSYIVQRSDNTYAYVVRGTVPSDWANIWEDADIGTLHDLPWQAGGFPADAQISGGAVKGWQNLTRSGSNGWADYLSRNLTPGATLYVVGHSLGGMLASVMGAYFYSEAEAANLDVTIRLFSFAGQTAGNQSFANAVDSFLDGTGRYFNNLDVVPKGFYHEDLQSIKKLYPGPRGPAYPSEEADLVIDPVIAAVGQKHFQPPRGTQLTSQVYDEPDHWYDAELWRFFHELLAQHSAQLYMFLLGTPVDVVRQLPAGSATWSPPSSMASSAESDSDSKTCTLSHVVNTTREAGGHLQRGMFGAMSRMFVFRPDQAMATLSKAMWTSMETLMQGGGGSSKNAGRAAVESLPRQARVLSRDDQITGRWQRRRYR